MAINLTKGQRIEIGLSKVGVGLGWDPNEGTGFDFDLDASAFMLGENKKLPKDEYFIFYNNLEFHKFPPISQIATPKIISKCPRVAWT
jgi:stress response protein SCP2